jgi:LytS/YehU family sensor histidine kinase
VVGLLTFLIGLILHKFISMKYANESIKSDILESKIKALENELNPHFLFNALNSTSELVYIDAQKAEEAMMKLSTFLRNAIGNPSLVPLAKELKMVQTYVDIENIRFDNKIRLNIQGEKEVLVPKFSIQLLAENAIKHGFCNDTLVIDIEIDEERIVVRNSGKLPKTPLVFGTGLRNLEERLTLLKVGKLKYTIDEKIAFYILFA